MKNTVQTNTQQTINHAKMRKYLLPLVPKDIMELYKDEPLKIIRYATIHRKAQLYHEYLKCKEDELYTLIQDSVSEYILNHFDVYHLKAITEEYPKYHIATIYRYSDRVVYLCSVRFSKKVAFYTHLAINVNPYQCKYRTVAQIIDVFKRKLNTREILLQKGIMSAHGFKMRNIDLSVL